MVKAFNYIVVLNEKVSYNYTKLRLNKIWKKIQFKFLGNKNMYKKNSNGTWCRMTDMNISKPKKKLKDFCVLAMVLGYEIHFLFYVNILYLLDILSVFCFAL